MNLRNCIYEDEGLLWELGYIRFDDYDIDFDDSGECIKLKCMPNGVSHDLYVDGSTLYVELEPLINGWFVDMSVFDRDYLYVDDKNEAPETIIRICKRQFVRLVQKKDANLKPYEPTHFVIGELHDVQYALNDEDVRYILQNENVDSVAKSDKLDNVFELSLRNGTGEKYKIVKCLGNYYLEDPYCEAYRRKEYVAPGREDVILTCFKRRFRRIDLL